MRHIIWNAQGVPAPEVLSEALGAEAPTTRHNCGKHADVYVDGATADELLGAAADAWRGPLLGKHDFQKERYLNDAAVVACDNGRVVARH